MANHDPEQAMLALHGLAMRAGRESTRRGWAKRGGMLVYATIILPVIMVILSLAIDFGYLICVRSELQAAVDAASLAGSSGLMSGPAEARSRAKAVALLNKVNGAPLVLSDSDIDLGLWNASARTFAKLNGAAESNANAVRVNGTLSSGRGNPVKLFILPALSPSAGGFDVNKVGISVGQRPTLDAVIVQDVSGSFAAEIASARSGDRSLLDALNTPGTKVNLGVSVFTGQAQTLSPIKSIATNYSALSASLDTLGVGTPGMPSTISGTDIAAGMQVAQSLFDGFVSTNTSRCMIIVSDGEPNQSSEGAHPDLSDAQLLTLAQSCADTAQSKGIDVYVVFWDSENNPTAADNLRTLIRGKGEFVHVTDPALLSSAIGTVLSKSQALVK